VHTAPAGPAHSASAGPESAGRMDADSLREICGSFVLHVPHADAYVPLHHKTLPAVMFTRVLMLHSLLSLLSIELRAPQQLWYTNVTNWNRKDLQLRCLADQMPQHFRFTAIAAVGNY